MKTEFEFKFELDSEVKLVKSDEFGTVIGRAEYSEHEFPSYLVRYKAGDGCQRENWFNEKAIVAK